MTSPFSHLQILVIILVFAGFSLPILYRKIQEKRRINTFNQIIEQINTLYKDVNAFRLSIESRQVYGMEEKSYTYGEVETLTLLEILSELDLRKGSHFYDLGSGSGKQVITASLYFPFAEAIGIELLDNLYEASQSCLTMLNKNKNNSDLYPIKFYRKDFLTCDYPNAGCILINATCMDDDLWKGILKKLDQIDSACYVIALTKSIPSSHFKLISEGMRLMSWGYATVRIYQKL